ncbi:ABC transporter permease [Pseudoalteromonas sp. GB56]
MTLKHFIQLTFTKVQLNLKSEAKKSYLSYLWWLLEPALFVGVFYLVFGVFLARGTSDFLVFLLCGQVPFLWFARTVTNGASSIEQGRALMQQIRIPKVFFPVVTIFQDFFKAICIFLLLFLVVLGIGRPVNEAWFSLPVIIFVQLVFVSSVAIMVAMVVPFIPDLKFLVATGIQLVMFASGIFYNYKLVILEQHHPLFLMNPMASLIEQYRQVLMHGVSPNFYALGAILTVSILILFACLSVLRKLDAHYPRVLVQ